MSEFSPDYSSHQALRASFITRAKQMRAAAAKAINPIVSAALMADAEMAERIADEIALDGASSSRPTSTGAT